MYGELKEEFRLKLSRNRVLRRIFRLNWENVTGGWENCERKGLMIFILHQIVLVKFRRAQWIGPTDLMAYMRNT